MNEPFAPEVAAAAERFARRAAREGLIDIGYDEVDSPWGRMLAAASDRGLLLLLFPENDVEAHLRGLAARVSPRILRSARALEPTRRELGEYFEGRRRNFDLPIDWDAVLSGFGRRVLEYTSAIPYGQVRTYREAATAAGNAAASRAAGNALGANPIPIIVPCHRVVRTGGGLGGYGGGLPRKEWLLDLERGRPGLLS